MNKKKTIIIFAVIALITLTVIYFFYQHQTIKPNPQPENTQSLPFWNKEKLRCSDTTGLQKLSLVMNSGMRINLYDLCKTFEVTTKIQESTGSFNGIRRGNDSVQSLIKQGKDNLSLYTNGDVSIVGQNDKGDITEVALGEGITQRIFWEFKSSDITSTLKGNVLKYEYLSAETPFTQYVYPESGLMFLAYTDSETMISLNLFAPISSDEYLKYNRLGSDNQLLQNYSFSVQ